MDEDEAEEEEDEEEEEEEGDIVGGTTSSFGGDGGEADDERSASPSMSVGSFGWFGSRLKDGERGVLAQELEMASLKQRENETRIEKKTSVNVRGKAKVKMKGGPELLKTRSVALRQI